MMDSSVSNRQESANCRKPLRCIVIDDEPIALRGMELLATRHSALRLEGAFSGASKALEWMNANPVDLVFLDIEMPGMKGIDLAARISEPTLIVFTTAYSEYAAASYDLEAVDYLLKPISSERFDRAVGRALKRLAALEQAVSLKTEPKLTLRADRRFVNIDASSIIYIEGMKDYVRIHTDSERIISRMTIKSLLDLLPPDRFLRIHKSFIVNTARIKAYDNSNLILQSLTSGTKPLKVPIGASFRANVLNTLSPGFRNL